LKAVLAPEQPSRQANQASREYPACAYIGQSSCQAQPGAIRAGLAVFSGKT